MWFPDQIDSRNLWRTPWPLLGSLILLIGTVAAMIPAAGWLMLAAFAAMVMLQMPVSTWVGAAVLLAVFSRLIVATGFAPQVLNFMHFPLVLEAVLIATVKPRGATIRDTRVAMHEA